MDLRYGWNGFVFDLRQARISTIVEFQEKNSSGEWDIRESPRSTDSNEAGDAEWESKENVRYSTPFRSLSANAQLVEGNTGAIYLGVPEDRKHSEENSNRLQILPVTIEEVIGDDSPEIAKNGQLIFNEGMPEMRLDDSVYLFFASAEQSLRYRRTGCQQFRDEVQPLCAPEVLALDRSLRGQLFVHRH